LRSLPGTDAGIRAKIKRSFYFFGGVACHAAIFGMNRRLAPAPIEKMKVLNLSCAMDHAFEGWFATLVEFERQSDEGLLRCPICDSANVRRLPAAPRLHLRAGENAVPASQDTTRQLLESLRTVIANSEDVGERFAEEARRIHYMEVKARNIRGIVNAEERLALAEEGIDVFALPMPMPPKESLQ